MNALLKFCVIFCLIYEVKGQITRCNYKFETYVTAGLNRTKTRYYTCDFSSITTNNNEKITEIDGQHRFEKVDADVKWIVTNYGNKLKTLSSIFCQIFPNLKVIQTLNAKLESIDEDSTQNCKELDQMLLTGNKIQELPEYWLIANSKLKYLQITFSQLMDLPENFLINQKNLEHLNLDNNQLNSLPSNIFRSLLKLEFLHLSINKIESINPEWLVNLQNLKHLSLSQNQISKILSKCFASLRNLEKLWLHKNQIKTLNVDSFEGLENLQTLSLSSNDISDLPATVFNQLKNLQFLSLNHNKLTTIHSDSFGVHNKLTEVYLQDNRIKTIDPKFINNTAVSTLKMRNNYCSELMTTNRNQIIPSLKKCMDNYLPRESMINSCGKAVEVNSTITEGAEVKRGMFPWIAALFGPRHKYFCGGTIVSNRKVVTAAHCMTLAAADISVHLGAHKLKKRNKYLRFVYAVQSIHIHPDWNPNTDTHDADVAVLVLTIEVTFSKFIQPICLANSSSDLARISKGVVVGYGKDEDPKSLHLDIPKLINMPIHQNEDCFLNDPILAKFSSKRTFCAGTETVVGICKGDRGSGLVVTDGTTYYLRGIVSAALFNSTYGCDVDTYSIFANVLIFTDWINGVSVEPVN